MDADIYQNLPADSELAFLTLEKLFREECEERVRNAHQDDNVSVFWVEYIAKVLGAISELGLEDEFQSEVPSIQEVSFQTYANFAKDVLNYCTRLEIRYGRRIQGFSVAFDAKTKSKVHHHINRIREIFTVLDLEERKREVYLGGSVLLSRK